ncbi:MULTISPECIES: penicillin-binding transpeptidase domain-containing protein [unclassified Streptomyces]|uniref:penicillin-binding transpeptidase domain-containing protein n=1 Tax=unclassified Streptomyces TaxID=2593676 RepID=UPI001BEC3B16|nr:MULTISPECIES: penicillin-binding transpeptidase domain-containing protein [unclassified Streptomyces]MBT2408254.1 penicillin-binding protein [Streptomyces sp. ISL-21]MBT2607469.1 penicillin-binding protein [Streptomyces sp. ISL-87]
MNGAAKGAIIGGVFLAMVGGAGYGVYALVGDAGDDSGKGPGQGAGGDTSVVAAKGSGPITGKEAAQAAKAFLAAWAAGDERAAADLTNNAQAAQSAVSDFKYKTYVTKTVITPGRQDGATVPYKVEAEITYEGVTKPLAYESQLTVVRGLTSGKPLVDWQASVIHPQLQQDEKLRAGAPASPPVKAVDRNGEELTVEKYPSLRLVLDELRETYGGKAGGKTGAEVWIEPATANAPKRTLLTLVEGEPSTIKTYLDAKAQAAAEKAVAKYPESSVVAVQPSNGHILAVANNRKDGFNAAMQGARAPGSTMKIVTAAMLLDRGKAAADKPAECVKEASWGGRSFHNLGNFELPGASFATSFAKSCNTAFIKQIDDVKDDSALSKEAREVFGIGLDWKTGVKSVDGKVPEATGAEAAAAYIGQGQITMNPLNVASITATARSGRFHQPVLVSPELDGRTVATAQRQMKSSVRQQLVSMMRLTATSGTGANAMRPVGGDKGAKTGSAEVDGAGSPDSWFTGFSDDVAAAAMVEGGGHGGDAAGPIVAQVLNS